MTPPRQEAKIILFPPTRSRRAHPSNGLYLIKDNTKPILEQPTPTELNTPEQINRLFTDSERIPLLGASVAAHCIEVFSSYGYQSVGGAALRNQVQQVDEEWQLNYAIRMHERGRTFMQNGAYVGPNYSRQTERVLPGIQFFMTA